MKIVLMILLYTNIVACGDGRADRVLNFYKDTECYELAKAVYSGDIEDIETIVNKDTTFLSCSESTAGTTILSLAMYAEKYESLKKLLELGANPNSINTLDKYSVLIESITVYGSQFEWNKHLEYTELLLKYGADPNYKIDSSFTNKKGYNVTYASPLEKAVSINLDYVKLLLEYGADYNQTVDENPIFYYAVRWGKVDIINYFIDSLNVDIFQPLDIYGEDTLYIQDIVINQFTFAKIKNNTKRINELKKQKADIEEKNQKLWELILKLEKMGVDFRNYEYKRYK
jgi:ankyrin repeat protein